jgi:hypothetical protein
MHILARRATKSWQKKKKKKKKNDKKKTPRARRNCSTGKQIAIEMCKFTQTMTKMNCIVPLSFGWASLVVVAKTHRERNKKKKKKKKEKKKKKKKKTKKTQTKCRCVFD